MKLSAPKETTWWIAVVLGVLGIIGYFTPLPIVEGNSFWLVTIGFVLLALGAYFKNL